MLQEGYVQVIQESFAKIRPNSSRFTRVLYDRLFELDPSLKHLFMRDIRDQRKKFYKLLDSMVKNLGYPEILNTILKELSGSRSHVREEDYKIFFNALIYTLSAALGNEFTPYVRYAWCEFCEYIFYLMEKSHSAYTTAECAPESQTEDALS